MTSESTHRLVVVRTDGLTHSSDFSGWHSETAAFRYFNEAIDDKRTVAAYVFQAMAMPGSVGTFYLRAEKHVGETASV